MKKLSTKSLPEQFFRFESDVAYTQFTLIIAMLSMRLGGSVNFTSGGSLARGF